MNGNSEREAKRNDDARPAGLASLSEPAIKRRLLSDAVQHPATLLPLAGSIVSALYLLLVSPVLGGSIWAVGLLALTGVVSIASFSWRYVFRYTEEYAKRARELMELLDRERARLEQVEVGQLREALQSGFSRVGDTDGLEALTELDAEYDQLQLALSRQIDGDLLSMSQVPGLAREAYRQGLSVLSDALDLTKVASKPGRERLEREVERLEKDIEGARGDDMQEERLRDQGGHADLPQAAPGIARPARVASGTDALSGRSMRGIAPSHSNRACRYQDRKLGGKRGLGDRGPSGDHQPGKGGARRAKKTRLLEANRTARTLFRRAFMLKEQVPEREGEKEEGYRTEDGEMAPAGAGGPAAPRALSDEEVQRVKSRAKELVQQLEDAAGSEQLELLDSVTNIGLQTQRDAARQLGLLKTRMGTFLNEGGSSAEIADGLRDLRIALNQINPHEVTQPGIVHRIVGVLPFVNGRVNPVVRALNKVALRYESVSRLVAVIETKLRDGQALLVRDNVELRQVYRDVESQQLPIQREAYLGELLMQNLSPLLDQSEDPVKRERIQAVLHDVAMRVRDLRTMEDVHVQYFVSIEMSRQNNSRLGQSVERTLTLATNVVTVGLAIQSAQIRQKGVLEATRRTREFLGDLVVANAAAIRRHTEEIGDLYNSPVIALEKITQAHNDLVEALDSAGRLSPNPPKDGLRKAEGG